MKQSILFRAQVNFDIKDDRDHSIKRVKTHSSRYRKLRLGLQLALVATLFATTTCSSSSNPNKMTAKEYYRYLLAENGYTDKDVEPNAEEIKKMLEKRKWLNRPNPELEQMVKASSAGEMLMPFLSDLLENMPQKYKMDNLDIHVGVFPLKDFNARTLRAPNGGILILVNRGLTKGLHEWAKLIFNIVFLQQDQPALPPDAPLEKILGLFKASYKNYSESRTFPAFPDYATDEKGILAGALSASAIEFILAHEYAHAILGHIDPNPIANPKDLSFKSRLLPEESDKREIDIDLVAAEIFLHASRDESQNKNKIFDTQMRLAGIYYNLTMFTILELLETPGQKEGAGTYPQIVLRVGNVKTYLEKTLDLSKYPIANDVARALDLVLNTSVVENPSIGELKGNDRLKKEFYIAFKSKNESKMREMISDNPEMFARWARDLMDLSIIFAQGNFESSAGTWTDGDFMNSSGEFRLALKVNNLYREKMNKDAVNNIIGKGATILRALQLSAKQFEAEGIASASQDKLKQAKVIEEILSLEIATQSK